MDEVLARVGLILGAIAVAAAVTASIRWRERKVPRRIDDPGLAPGVYLFTSAACPDCVPARERLTEALGEAGFVEVAWEEQPEVFQRVGAAGVPSTLVVDDSGRGRLWPGQPDAVLKRLGP